MLSAHKHYSGPISNLEHAEAAGNSNMTEKHQTKSESGSLPESPPQYS
jgi:hypothetical protein